MTTPQLDARRQAFVASYIKTKSVVTAAVAASYPQWMALSIGMEMLASLQVQRAIVLGMPAGADRIECAAAWMLDPDTAEIAEPVTLASRIEAKRAELAAAKLDGAPSLIVINRPPPSRRAFRRLRQEAAQHGVSAQ